MTLESSPTIQLPTSQGRLHLTYYSNSIKEAIVIYKSMDFENSINLRIHNSCVFSESFRTTDCDCRDQLQKFLELIGESNGLLIYVFDEGRGTGLKNKFEAINIQQSKGLNTLEAFEILGLAPDKTDYFFESEILKNLLPNREFTLHTNNPRKLEALVKNGIFIIKRNASVVVSNETVRKYLKGKADNLNHDIDL